MKFKKGQKVVRFSGYSSGIDKKMVPGDVGTVSKNQKYPGVVELSEFPGSMGHYPDRLIRIDHLPKKLQNCLINLSGYLDHESTHVRREIIDYFVAGYAVAKNLKIKHL